MNRIFESIGRSIARYLDRPASGYEPFAPTDPGALQATIRKGDVLLVEGNSHISGVIKYLTQSTWSHAALYVGLIVSKTGEEQKHMLLEASLEGGVAAVPLSKYFQFRTRICRPVNLSADDCDGICRYAVSHIGSKYDLKNIFDLVRYLVPLPVPQRWRRRNRPRFRRPDEAHLFWHHRASVPARALPNPTQNNIGAERSRAGRTYGDPPFVALCAARFRSFTLLCCGQTVTGTRLRLPCPALDGLERKRSRRDEESTESGCAVIADDNALACETFFGLWAIQCRPRFLPRLDAISGSSLRIAAPVFSREYVSEVSCQPLTY
jgi:hypothetical protein